MNRKTNLRDMDAPAVGSGADAKETTLKGTASLTASEKGSNSLKEYTTGSQPKGGAGGKAAFK